MILCAYRRACSCVSMASERMRGKKLNPIATESFKDFYLHRNKTFLEGGYNKRADLADWVRMKGFVIP